MATTNPGAIMQNLTKGMAKSMMRLRMASKSIGFNRCELGMRGGVNGHRIRRACESGRK